MPPAPSYRACSIRPRFQRTTTYPLRLACDSIPWYKNITCFIKSLKSTSFRAIIEKTMNNLIYLSIWNYYKLPWWRHTSIMAKVYTLLYIETNFCHFSKLRTCILQSPPWTLRNWNFKTLTNTIYSATSSKRHANETSNQSACDQFYLLSVSFNKHFICQICTASFDNHGCLLVKPLRARQYNINFYSLIPCLVLSCTFNIFLCRSIYATPPVYINLASQILTPKRTDRKPKGVITKLLRPLPPFIFH